MADRKQFLNVVAPDPELVRVLEQTRNVVVTEAQLREQRISFAYGNSLGRESSSKEDVRLASEFRSFANLQAAKASR
jgi:hypothetical protein